MSLTVPRTIRVMGRIRRRSIVVIVSPSDTAYTNENGDVYLGVKEE